MEVMSLQSVSLTKIQNKVLKQMFLKKKETKTAKIDCWSQQDFLFFSPLLHLSFQVSATFAASLVTSPAIGAYLSVAYGDTLVVILATVISLLDICFILVAVPESLPEKMRPASWGAPISWEQADPFAVSRSYHANTDLKFVFISLSKQITSSRLF